MNAQQARFLFPPEDLPPGFKFPAAFLDVVKAPELPELTPWWFLAKREKLARGWLDILREQYPERSLVPFAKWDPSDDVACFDGADTSGNPVVFLIHTFTTPGWEQRGTLPDFGAWLAQAAEDAREYAAENEET
jgi:hypothetical protein